MSENRPAPSATTDMPVPTSVPDPDVQPTNIAPVSPPSVPAPEPVPAVAEPPSPIAARFGQLAAQRREAEARAERLERLVTEQGEQLKQALAAIRAPATQSPPQTTATAIDAKPSRDAFPDQESYESELVSWAGTRAAATAAAELRRVQEEAETARQERARADEEARAQEARAVEEAKVARELWSGWESRRAKAIEVHPDFSAVAESESLPISLAMSHVLVTHEAGPEIAYYLGKNPTEAARIASLVVPGQTFPAEHPQAGLPVPNAVAQAFELGRIAAKLVGNEAPVVQPTEATPATPVPPGPVVTPPQIVVLPAPPTPITGASATATRKDPNDMTMEEYAAARRPQLLAERRPGRIH